MKIYAIFDSYKSCYDCPDQIHNLYATHGLALQHMRSKFSDYEIKAGLVYIDELELVTEGAKNE